ncbi:MAG: hypothetical protein OQJ97_18240 [Rhodospirillales bacterium]|nr:hypothetical protein [Rhodospirillales bacterium]
MNKILIGVGALGVVVAIGVFVLMSNLGGLIKAAVETAGTEVTKVQVTLDSADVETTSGKGSLSGLTVGNPAGFKSDYAFKLGGISMQLDVGSLASDTIVIKNVTIDRPAVTYELSSNGSNIDAIKKNVEQVTSGGGASSKTESSGGKKVVIENLYVKGGQINVSAEFLGGKSMTSPLPDLHLKDLGKDSGGASPAQIAEKVIAALTNGATSAVGKLDISSITEGVKGLAGDAMKNVEAEAGKAAAGATDKLKEATGDAAGALKGLLGN